MKKNHIIILTAAIVILAGAAIWLHSWLYCVQPQPIVLNLHQDSAGSSSFTLDFTNAGGVNVVGNYAGEVFKEGGWFNAKPQIQGAGSPFPLAQHEGQHFVIDAPKEGVPWRVSFKYDSGESTRHAHLRELFGIRKIWPVIFSQEIRP